MIEYHHAMAIGANIQAWRLSRGQSVEALVAKAGVPSSSLNAIESGELDPTVSILEALATALGIPPSWLHSDPSTSTCCWPILTGMLQSRSQRIPSIR